MNTKKEVIIIGAGLSGLTIAFHLEKAGISYKLIEARNRTGGRIKTHRTGSNSTIELGATWFSDKHRHLMHLIKELNISYEHQFVGENILYDYHNGGRKVEAIQVPPSQEHTYLFANGTDDLTNTLYAHLNPSSVYFSEPIKSLSCLNKYWEVITTQRSFKADYVISTIPPNLFANTISLNPALPEALQQLSLSTHTWMGESMKVGAEFSNGVWREKGIGSFYSQFGPMVEFYDHQHSNSHTPRLMGFMDLNGSGPDQEAREKQFLDQLALYFGAMPEIQEYVEKDWRQEPFTYHPYQLQVIPHQNNGHRLFREPMFDGHFFYAGSETALHFPGYMDGAVERAVEVSKEVLNLIRASKEPSD